MHIGLWVIQALLALVFLASGGMKVITPIDELVKQGMTWAADAPWLPRFIGVSEVAGALGLILPSVTRIKPMLTPLAASCLALVMALAVGVHLVIEGSVSHAIPALVLGALCAFVAWGRTKKAPIAPKP